MEKYKFINPKINKKTNDDEIINILKLLTIDKLKQICKNINMEKINYKTKDEYIIAINKYLFDHTTLELINIYTNATIKKKDNKTQMISKIITKYSI